VEAVIKDIDVPSRQVLIDARIVVADDTFGRSLGVRLGFGGSGQSGNTGFGAGTYGTSATSAISGLPASAPTSNVNLGLTNPSSLLGLSVYNAATAAILSLELQAMELTSAARSSPTPASSPPTCARR